MRILFIFICLTGLCCRCLSTDITFAPTSTPETTALTVNNSPFLGNASASGFPVSDVINFSVPESEPWTINAGTGALHRKAGATIDFETTPNLPANITATGLSGTTLTKTFTITITNVNEPPTAVSFLTGGGSIAENSVGVVGTLQSDDPDAGDVVTYSTTDPRFQISGTTLSLIAGNALDFEVSPTATVVIKATDKLNLSVSTSVIVQVTNVNEAPTSISFQNGGTIAENSVGLVGSLKTNDPDAGDTITYTTNDARFQLTGNVLSVKAGNEFNFETNPSTQVSITATDVGKLFVTVSVSVVITNVNEAPAAVSFQTGGAIAENSVGTVGTLQAGDPDANDTVTFSTNDSRFQITASTLTLKTSKAFDFETMPTTTVMITATDAGNLSVTTALNITVNNVNEAITGISFKNGGTIAENLAGAVGTLQAADPDANDSVTFSTADVRFQIKGTTLSVKAGAELNFEAAQTTLVSIHGVDAGGIAVDFPVTVTVTNVNEAPTLMVFANGGTIDENKDGNIDNLTVTDPDSGDAITLSTTDTRFTISGTTLALKTGVTLNFEAGASVGVIVTATDRLGLTLTTTLSVGVNDKNDPPVMDRWAKIGTEVVNASLDLPVSTSSDVIDDEDLNANFRDYHNLEMVVSFSTDNAVNPGAANDSLSLLPIPPDLSAILTSDLSAKKIFTGTVFLADYWLNGSNEVHFRLTNVSTTPISTTDLTRLIRLVGYKPNAVNLGARTVLKMSLNLGGPVTTRLVALDTANFPPALTNQAAIPVTRFSQVTITPTMLGISDEHVELGLRLFIDYPTLYGKLYTANRTQVLGPDDSIPVTYTAPVAPATVGTLHIDLTYVPDTSSAVTKDACFMSLEDSGAKATATSATWLRSPPTKIRFTIENGAYPVVLNEGIPSYTEGSDPIAVVQPAATLSLGSNPATDALNFGVWNLYVSYAALNPLAGPGNTTELLGIRPFGTISVAADGRTILRSGRTIAQIDAAAKGSESALLVILVSDITGSELIDLIKALSYRDSSRRLPVNSKAAAATRALYVGFVQKNVNTVVADITIFMHRVGIENPSAFKDGTSRTVLTVSNLTLLGSSVIEDIDTAEIPILSVTTFNGGIASAEIQRGAEDTGDTYRTTIGWRLTRNPTLAGDQDFFLKATIGGATLQQTITLSPRSGSDLSLAIASDAPLALIKPLGTATPLKRAVRVRRGADAVEDAAIFLLGDAIPPWITIDSTAGTVSYDLADARAVAGKTYKFSVLATTAATATASTSAAEQPVVLRVVAQPVLSGTN